MKKAVCPALVLIALLLFFTFHSVALSDDAESLKGLKAVWVVIEELPETLKSKAGLTKEQLQTDVELKLRLAGIRVVPGLSEGYHIPGQPYLYVNINGHVEETGLVVYNIDVELK